MRSYVKGLTLVELVVFVAIVGALAPVILPFYDEYLKQMRATQAIALLTETGSTMKQGFEDTGNFNCINTDWGTKYFNYTCHISESGDDYNLTASGVGHMSKYIYRLDAAGKKLTLAHPVKTAQCV